MRKEDVQREACSKNFGGWCQPQNSLKTGTGDAKAQQTFQATSLSTTSFARAVVSQLSHTNTHTHTKIKTCSLSLPPFPLVPPFPLSET